MHNSLMCAQFPIKFIIFLMSLSLLLPLQRKKRNPSLRKIPHEPTTNKKMVVYPLKYCINDEIEEQNIHIPANYLKMIKLNNLHLEAVSTVQHRLPGIRAKPT